MKSLPVYPSFIGLLMLLLMVPSLRATFQLELEQGWNLVSIPVTPEDPKPSAVLAGIEDQVLSVWTYEQGAWRSYVPAIPELSDLRTLTSGKAYWIEMAEAASVILEGLPAATSVRLQPGWNMIGVTTETPVDTTETLGIFSASEYIVVAWRDQEWITSMEEDIATLMPGEGYWLFVSKDGYADFGTDLADEYRADPLFPGDVEEYDPNEGQLRLGGGSENPPRVGDIIASSATEAAPFGFVGRVTSVSEDGTEVDTSRVGIGEVVGQGRGVYQGGLQLPPVVANQSSGQNTLRQTLGIVFFPVDQSFEEGDATVTITGNITFEPIFTAFVEIDEEGELTFETELGGDIQSSLMIDVTGQMETNQEFVLLEQMFEPVTVEVGDFPITFVPQVRVVADVVGTVPEAMNFGVRQAIAPQAKVRLTDGGWGYAPQAQADVELLQETDVIANLKARVGAEFDVFVYDQRGPSIKLLGVADCFTNEEGWGIYGGVEFEMGVRPNDFIGGGIEVPDTLAIEGLRLKLYPIDPATVRGEVRDSLGPLAGVAVTITDGAGEPVDFDPPIVTDTEGQYMFLLEAGSNYQLTYSLDGYVSEIVTIDVDAGYTRDMPDILLEREGVIGGFGGTVFDALTGEGVPGVELIFRRGTNAVPGFSPIAFTSLTDAAGQYLIADAEAANYTVSTRKDGYLNGLFIATNTATAFDDEQNGTITPIQTEQGNLRVVLSWGDEPDDLDAHLTGPNGMGGRFHVFFQNPGSQEMVPFALLDRDDIEEFGPETITVSEFQEGLYRYSVHDFTNVFATYSMALANSGARVEVYRGDTRVREFQVPNGDGTLWTVFTFDENGTITPVNNLSYESDPVMIQSARRGTDGPLLLELPAKKSSR